jgi:hypothetical protein
MMMIMKKKKKKKMCCIVIVVHVHKVNRDGGRCTCFVVDSSVPKYMKITIQDLQFYHVFRVGVKLISQVQGCVKAEGVLEEVLEAIACT